MTKRKVLLIYGNPEQKPMPIMPVGLAYVSEALENAGHIVNVLDLMFVKNWEKAVLEKVEAFSPEVVGISIRNIDNCDYQNSIEYLELVRQRIIEPLRSANVDKIMIGGPAVNTCPQQVVDFVGADAAVYGDGELITAQLVDEWCQQNQPIEVAHVVWRSNIAPEKGSKKIEPGRLKVLNRVRSPNLFKWVDVRPYLRRGTAYSVQTKRGCAFSCSYCIYRQIEGSRYRLRDPQDIAAEIKDAYEQAGVWYFEFTDSVFNNPPDHAIAVCQAIEKLHLPISLNASGLNPKFLSKKLLEAMKRAGFEEYSLAPETASEKVMAGLGKGYTKVQTLVEAAKMAREHSLPVIWWFSFGLPGEDENTVQESLAFIRKYVRSCDAVVATIGLRILPNTNLAKLAYQEGQISNPDEILKPVFYQPPDISLERIAEMVEKASDEIPMMFTPSIIRKPSIVSSFIAVGVAKVLFKHRRPVWFIAPRLRRFF